jgi:phosphoribosylformimino-5-aminoimidazole carboxamide ribotide isomerase
VRIAGVIDLRRGQAVHARGGHRDRYEPVSRAAGVAIDGDPLALVRAYVATGVCELYVADLDAIAGAPPQSANIARLAGAGVPIMLDAGVSSLDGARQAGATAARVVVGLETLSSWDTLEDIANAIGPTRTVFSLDLRDGIPLGRVASGGAWPVPAIAARAVAAGAGSVIVIDLARVGTSAGPDVERLLATREAIPGIALLAAGGVRNAKDLDRLAECGCDGALVATALHDGRLSSTDVAIALGHRRLAGPARPLHRPG